MTTGRRRLVPALVLVAASLVVAGSLPGCGRFGGNDTNPRSDEKRESAPAPDVTPPARAPS